MEEQLKIEETEFQEAGQVVEQEAEQVSEEQGIAQRAASENRARETGWVPKEEFRGDLRKWREADAWNRHADTMLPIANAANKKLREELASLKEKLTRNEDVLGRITKMQEKYSGDFYERTIAEIDAAMDAAVAEGDVPRVRELREQRGKIAKPEPIQPPPVDGKQTESIHPDVAQWQADNQWFDPESTKASGNAAMTAYAIFVGNQLAKKNDPVSFSGKEKEFCQKVSAMVKAEFPDKFRNLNRDRQEIDGSNFRGGGGEEFRGDNRGKTWNDLPQEAKDYFVNTHSKQWPKDSKEKYAATYFSIS